jgi:hypothetical protein
VELLHETENAGVSGDEKAFAGEYWTADSREKQKQYDRIRLYRLPNGELNPDYITNTDERHQAKEDIDRRFGDPNWNILQGIYNAVTPSGEDKANAEKAKQEQADADQKASDAKWRKEATERLSPSTAFNPAEHISDGDVDVPMDAVDPMNPVDGRTPPEQNIPPYEVPKDMGQDVSTLSQGDTVDLADEDDREGPLADEAEGTPFVSRDTWNSSSLEDITKSGSQRFRYRKSGEAGGAWYWYDGRENAWTLLPDSEQKEAVGPNHPLYVGF